MTVLRRLARPMLAAPLVTGGLRTLRRPEAAAEAAGPVVRAVGKRLPVLAGDPLQLVRVTGAIQATAGLLLATGRAPRLAALTLAATLVPTSLATHAFWKVEDPEERARQRAHFLTDLSALGGLLIASADTHGKPSLAYRSRHALDHRHPVRAVRRPVEAAAARTAHHAKAVTAPLTGSR
ncbi:MULTISPECIES: DoxX family membrane protein [Streptomyces]|uniref:DoxX family membrane protein n=2 Tax=Streptomyces TaxID=1883 RepID=UPI0005639048|nr:MULTISPECIES: DoxX family membrane protein [Streptomyces]AKL64364.1 DoxX family protein [Streptomyces sp. Mg1]RPK43232.1 DoxX [Streptomyces sp. ADI91-18]WSR96874.1 DoxX family membrane protein [Streptomyces goshikiensis]